MFRATIVLAFVLSSASALAARPSVTAPNYDRISERLERDERRPLAVDALTSMLTVAARNLEDSGRQADADRLLGEWEITYRDVVAGVTEDMGDHAPLSEWLATWYALLEAELGVEFMELSHLRDIFIMNFSMPVVFSPTADEPWCIDQLHDHPSDSCAAEYARHFVGTKYGPVDPYNTTALHHGFAGVVAYWITYASCSAALAGVGAMFICGPAGSIVEVGIEIFVAPDVSTRIWERNNPI